MHILHRISVPGQTLTTLVIQQAIWNARNSNNDTCYKFIKCDENLCGQLLYNVV